MSRKLLFAALVLGVFGLPASYAFAQGHGGGGHGAPAMHMSAPPAMHMDRDAHGDAVSQTAAEARANGSKVGPTVHDVANDKNKGKHEAKGHGKTKHSH
jgi:hypothetical protein